MEDHRDAYFFWKELGLEGLPCVHVDAHLDVSNLKTPGCEVALSPEINCGNYLLPAMEEGIVESLIWVIPDHLPGELGLLDWCRGELQNWVHLELVDYMSLEESHGRVEGTLLDKSFVVCFSRDIPQFDGPVLLDIDVDYYLSPDDGIWQSPLELNQHISHLTSAATTIAYSIQGGYTPVRHRFLGPLTELCLSDPALGEAIWNSLHSEESVLQDAWPEWVRPALLAREGKLDDAIDLDGGYLVQPIDHVCAALMREKFEQAREHLQEVVNPTEARFMDGMICFKSAQFGEACDIWLKLLEDEELEPRTQVYLRTLCGRALIEAKRFEEAVDTLSVANTLCRRDSEITYLMARAKVANQELESGAKLYRRAIKFAPGRMETAEVKLELAELYLALGQRGLADRLINQIVSGDTPGFMKLRAEALKLKLAIGITT